MKRNSRTDMRVRLESRLAPLILPAEIANTKLREALHQRAIVIAFLEANLSRGVTTKEFRRYEIMSPATRVKELRDRGYAVETQLVRPDDYPDGERDYGIYVLKDYPDSEAASDAIAEAA